MKPIDLFLNNAIVQQLNPDEEKKDRNGKNNQILVSWPDFALGAGAIFLRNTSTNEWNIEAILEHEQGDSWDEWGTSVSIQGNSAVMASLRAKPDYAGAVAVFRRAGCPVGQSDGVHGNLADPDTCQLCPVGTFANSSMQFCTPCPAGTWSDIEGAHVCTACEAGYIGNSTGATSDAFCTPCGPGEFSNVGASQCSP